MTNVISGIMINIGGPKEQKMRIMASAVMYFALVCSNGVGMWSQVCRGKKGATAFIETSSPADYMHLQDGVTRSCADYSKNTTDTPANTGETADA